MRVFPSLAVVAGGLALFVLPAHGQDDAMEFQRCIWQCLANSTGADDPAYQQCITNICDGGAPEYSAPPEGQWGYGHHPILGLSAHINVGDHALGFACIEGDGGYSVSHRVTRGFLPNQTAQAGVVNLFLNPFQPGGSSTFNSSDGDYDEQKNDYCLSGIDNYRRSQAVIFLDVEEMSLTTQGDGSIVMGVVQNGSAIDIRTENDLDQISGKLTLPLTGSSAAIRELTNQCGSLGYQISLGCDY